MDLWFVGVVLACILSLSATEETYENSTNLCERCKCTQSKQKFILDCQKQEFHHSIAEWPKHNTSLSATFSFNNISNLEILPDSDFVTELILDNCGIKSLDNGVFKTVRNVKYVDLSYNFLTTEQIAPEKFKGPYNDSVYEPLSITHLDLSYNEIHSLPHNVFEHLNTLQYLNLAGNRLKVLDRPTQVALSGLSDLEVLNLANNDLTELAADAVKPLKKLKSLDLSYNKIDFVPDTLRFLGDSLETLYLDHTLIFELTDESFLGVHRISHLSLRYLPRLQLVHPNAFSPLKNLKILHLSDNPILIHIDRDAFGVNQTLTELHIGNNSLRELHYGLTKWSSLQMLTLSGNEFECDCDLYKISHDLNWDIKGDKNGPVCINPFTDTSLMIYNLTDDICVSKMTKLRMSHVINGRFQTLRIILMVFSTVLFFTTLLVLTLAFIKYKRYRMNQNYSFATQVMYNPLRNTTGIY